MAAKCVFPIISLLLFMGVVSPLDGMPTFIVTSPKRAKFDTPTTFAISASNLAQPETIHLLLRTGDASEINLNETTLRFESDGVQTWSVVMDSARMTDLLQRTFQLRAEYGSVVKSMEIPMNPLSGHVMIQTDKLIYTPRQTVMYRIIALDDDQRFAKWPVTVDIKNPDLIILERQHHTSEQAFVGKNFTLPRDATTGTWTISATFEGTKVRTTKTIKFDVQEYVLPTFKVEVSVQEKVIALSTSWLRIKVKAIYTYGEPVQGSVQMRLGFVKDDRIYLFNTSYSSDRGLDDNGEWSMAVPVRDMRSHRLWFPNASPLYIEANVTEAGTGEVGTAVDMKTLFANPFYRISFDRSKKYFKPGFDYTMAIEVEAANGDKAANISVFVSVEMKTENGAFLQEGFGSTFELDAHGRMNHTFPIPGAADGVNIRVVTLDPRAPELSEDTMTVNKFVSPTNTFLQLSQEGNSIRIQYTPAPQIFIGSRERITVVVISRGQLLHTASVPRDSSGSASLPLSRDLLVASSPAARVVAYFYIGGTNMEIVADSLFVDTEDICREELSLFHGFHGQQMAQLPKQTTELNVEGGGNMRVGLLAVDERVYILRNERSLTRDKIFEMLGEADEGRGIGDGRDTDKIFEYAGLEFIKLTEAYEATVPVFDAMLHLSGLNTYFPQGRRAKEFLSFGNPNIFDDEETIPLDEVRKYFPESWLFKEITLPEDGYGFESITLPDTITTWSLTAVGVGAQGGVCMSRPLHITVFKPFFAQVRLPYKAVRLEQVTVDIGIYNYKTFDINVTVTVQADQGLCFSEGFGGQHRIQYRATLRARQTNSESIRMIPLVAGSVKLIVDVRSTNGRERDIVEKTLHVVAEGRRVQKSISFPLDPSGKHSSHTPANRNGVRLTNTASISNRIVSKSNKQLTQINLYMPEEVIQGSEKGQISACGDLMGDIISTAVLQGDNLFESSVVDAEEAIGNLAPTVHALLYLNQSNFMTPYVQEKGQAHVTYGVSRLLSYRKTVRDNASFGITPDSPPATWLTALVLKTLCHAKRITFIDTESLITRGFIWMSEQGHRETSGALNERDRRLARPSRDYDLMLSAETLIALHECNSVEPINYEVLPLMGDLEMFLADNLGDVTSPLVMAKTAYALTLSDPRDDITLQAVQRLKDMMRETREGLHYWSVTSENELPQRPFWYHSGTRASSIEATAYGLLVFSRQAAAPEAGEGLYGFDYGDDEEEEEEEEEVVGAGGVEWNVNLDSIAGWLIQKRNSRGAFIGAMDTAAATQALSEYSLSKQDLNSVDLHCNVTTRPTQNYTHSFDFNEENAITPKSLSNVPVGRQLHIETRGTGLGQMQVRVEYNVPVQANAMCRYDVTITRRTMSYNSRSDDRDEVCRYCNMGCDDENHEVTEPPRTRRSAAQLREARYRYRPQYGADLTARRRVKRQRITASRVSMCIEVCLRSTENNYADRTILSIAMLSGFEPYADDLTRIYEKRDQYSLSSLVWVEEKETVELKFNQVPHDRNTCVSFRAIERRDVTRRNPAIVTVRPHDEQEPTCVHTYDPVVSEVNLAVYCANNQTSNQGQCRCISGMCGACHTRPSDVDLNDMQRLVCDSEFIYKIRLTSTQVSDDWVDITADVIRTEKNGSDEVETEINMVTPRTCSCPHTLGVGSQHYFFGSHYDLFVDRNNDKKKTYLLDQTTAFVSQSLGSSDQNRAGNWIRMAMGGHCGD
uniref:Complement C3-like protein 2 n=1 Tax=Littorina littorea TaxID=31216 RepID=A0A2P1L4A9_LITLI|nr:complement C3-like protein 2 [Littorina littorea]